MNAINNFDHKEISNAKRMVQINAPYKKTHPSNINLIDSHSTDGLCPFDSNTNYPPDSNRQSSPIIHHSRVLELPSISEEQSSYESNNITLHGYERKLSNTSVHKKRRGLIRRIKQQTSLIGEQQSLRGLKRYKIMQNGSGANRCITNEKAVLLTFKKIPAIPIGGIEKNSPALFATGHGLLPFRSEMVISFSFLVFIVKTPNVHFYHQLQLQPITMIFTMGGIYMEIKIKAPDTSNYSIEMV